MRQGQFWAIPKEVMEMIGLPLEARIIFGIFWTRQNGDNVAWPGQQYIADIIGWHSAAGRALTELRRRLAAGEDVACYNRRGVAFVVGPRLKDRPA